ncbi:hypothetical protein [Lysinibacillus sp. NPDC056232]
MLKFFIVGDTTGLLLSYIASEISRTAALGAIAFIIKKISKKNKNLKGAE